jgi:TRAP-type C4-dicarboxylate transport system substrate-binding protein
MCVRPEWLEGLPPDLKKVVYGVFRELSFYRSYSYAKQADAAKEEFRKHGAEISALAKEDVLRMKELVAPIEEKWVLDMESKGLPAKEFVNEMRSLNQKYGSLAPAQILDLQRTDPVPMGQLW